MRMIIRRLIEPFPSLLSFLSFNRKTLFTVLHPEVYLKLDAAFVLTVSLLLSVTQPCLFAFAVSVGEPGEPDAIDLCFVTSNRCESAPNVPCCQLLAHRLASRGVCLD